MARKANSNVAANATYTNAIATCKANAHKTAQPGIIASIMQQLVAAKQSNKAVTVAQLLNTLHTQFPQRTIASMSITVRAQLSRLPKQRKFNIVKTRVGRVVTYKAA